MFNLKQNDTSPAIRVQLTANGQPVNLTGATIVAHMRGPKVGTRRMPIVFEDRAMITENVETGIVRLGWRAGDTARAGEFQFEVQVTFGDGTIETFPNDGYEIIKITEEIA